MTSSATAGAEARSNDVRKLDRRPWAVRVREQCAALKLHPTTRLVALTVATYFDEHGSWAMPIVEIERATGLKRAAVFKHLAILIGKGVGVLGRRPRRRRASQPLQDRHNPPRRWSAGQAHQPVHDGGPPSPWRWTGPVHDGGPASPWRWTRTYP